MQLNLNVYVFAYCLVPTRLFAYLTNRSIFLGIDENVKRQLQMAWEIKNVNRACNQANLLSQLESIQEQLDICKKSLSDFLDGRRRQFPRYVKLLVDI